MENMSKRRKSLATTKGKGISRRAKSLVLNYISIKV